ncbi:AP-4 complex subunit epsilon-1 [Mortierella polycephala]|uniref:AP-4 complex subunit epsilon-1 n=1 Tax=Mortierella polycephala TaxID=41804 RepID=A0A9P6PY57_9FUNG|nr:AP-4 complex subunit epsilon-1 [Mortierella polycephala]
MARLGQDDLSASMAMTPVVMASFHKARHGVDAAFGVLFEVIRTLNSFHPAIILDLCQSKDVSRNPLLIIPRFATSSNQNLKYLGISMLCNVHPNAWSDAWWGEELLSSVVQALESRDMAIQRRALDLLYRMLTLENSENIIERLLYAFYQDRELTQAADPQDKTESRVTFPSRQEKLLTQILDAAERFGLSEQWYLDMVFDLLDRGGLAVTMQTVEKVMAVIERGAKSPAFNTAHLRAVAVQKSNTVLAQKDYRLSSIDHHHSRVRQPALAYFIFWVLGEYGDNTDEWSLASIQETLARCLLINHDPLIQAFILSALTKVALRSAPNPVPSSIMALVQERILELPSPSASFTQSIHPYNSSFANVDVQQRAHEFFTVADLVS